MKSYYKITFRDFRVKGPVWEKYVKAKSESKAKTRFAKKAGNMMRFLVVKSVELVEHRHVHFVPMIETTLEICELVRSWQKPDQLVLFHWLKSPNADLIVSLSSQGLLSITPHPQMEDLSYVEITEAFFQKERELKEAQ